MADYLIKGETLSDIANAIRDKTGSTEPILTEDMAQGVESAYERGLQLFKGRIFRTTPYKVKKEHLQGIGNALKYYAFYADYNITHCELPDECANVYAYAFGECIALQYLSLGKNMVFVESSAISNTKKLAAFDLLRVNSVPSCALNNFSSFPEYAKIIVPFGRGNEFISATNWSNFAHMIVEANPNDEIGIIYINDPSGNFLMSFCFVKGWNWEQLIMSEFGRITDGGVMLHQLLENGSGEPYYGRVVLEYDVGSRGYMLDDVTMDMVVTEGTYTTTEVDAW